MPHIACCEQRNNLLILETPQPAGHRSLRIRLSLLAGRYWLRRDRGDDPVERSVNEMPGFRMLREVMYAILLVGAVLLAVGLIVFGRFYFRERMSVLEKQAAEREG